MQMRWQQNMSKGKFDVEYEWHFDPPPHELCFIRLKKQEDIWQVPPSKQALNPKHFILFFIPK